MLMLEQVQEIIHEMNADKFTYKDSIVKTTAGSAKTELMFFYNESQDLRVVVIHRVSKKIVRIRKMVEVK